MLKKVLVKKILENAINYEWSIQGFGMLRLYLEDEIRLHIWDTRYKIKDVSIIHTHPWNFHSYVIAGILFNQDWKEVSLDDPFHFGFWRQEIITGEQATATPQNKTILVGAIIDKIKYYGEGDTYYQDMTIPHQTCYEDGTVTIIERDSRLDNNFAYSYWNEEFGPNGWVSAAPRKATEAEILDIVENSLEKFFY